MNGLGCVGRVEIGKLNGVWDYMGEKRWEEKDEKLLIKSLCTAFMKDVTYSVSWLSDGESSEVYTPFWTKWHCCRVT